MWTWIKLFHDSGHQKDLVGTVLEALGSTISDELLEEVNDYQLVKTTLIHSRSISGKQMG
jgi:hypothetical protein